MTQEVEALFTTSKACDPCLVGVQVQPELGQGLLHPPLSLDHLAPA